MVSRLLDRPRHSVTVTEVASTTENPYGGDQPVYTAPTSVKCTVVPVSAPQEIANLGVQAITTYKIFARTWPGGIHSIITWNGRMFDQVGEAEFWDVSPRTSHYEVLMQARYTEVL